MISKAKAIELINKKIVQLESIKEPRNRDNPYDEIYDQVYYGTEELIAQLFPKEKIKEFRSNLPTPSATSGPRNYAAEIRSYKNHIETCIALLKAYRETIEEFWPENNRIDLGKATEPVSRIELDLFKPAALERIARIIGNRYTGVQLAEFFKKAGFPHYSHDGRSTKWVFVYGILQEIQSGNNGLTNVMRIIEQLCEPQEYFGIAAAYESVLKEVNEVLNLYGLIVKKNGKIAATDKTDTILLSHEDEDAKLFDSRSFHPEIEKHGQSLFLQRQYFHAVFECCKAFDKYVREKSKLDQLSGAGLMGTAFSLEKGRLRLNALQTQTERDEQEGLKHLCMGLVNAIRTWGA